MSVNTNSASNAYRDAANEFILQIRQFSASAADCIERIQVQYGTRAAYLAAFALVDLKQRQIERKYNPSQHDVHSFTFCDEMRESAEAIQLYDEAAAHLLPGLDAGE